MKKDKYFLTCERYYIFEFLIMAAGMMGAYTYIIRGGVFSNAQTANIMMMAIGFGKGEGLKGAYYLIPAGAYILGTVFSELLPKKVRKTGILRWDTLLIGFELLVLIIVGLIPTRVPNQVVQIMISFICAMQYNTFRQAQGINMATTFVTNHVRQVGVSIANILKHRDDMEAREKGKRHLFMLIMFFLGALILAALCPILQEKAIWLAVLPMGVCFSMLLHADLTDEKDLLENVPGGH